MKAGSRPSLLLLWGCMAFLVFDGCGVRLDRTTLLQANGTIHGKENRMFEVKSPDNGYLRITVLEQGINVRVVVADEDGTNTSTYQSNTGRFGAEIVVANTNREQTNVISVETPHRRAELQGKFEITIDWLKTATDAEHAFSAASRVDETASSREFEQQIKRLEQFEFAAKAFVQDDLYFESGLAYLAASALAAELELDRTRILTLANSASSEFSKTELRLVNAEALTIAAETELFAEKTWTERSENVSKRLAVVHDLYRNAGDAIGEAETETYWGKLYYDGSTPAIRQRASLHWERARGICRVSKGRVCEALALQNLATVERDATNYERALVMFDEALALFEKEDDPRLYAVIQSNIGFTESWRNRYDAAIAAHKLALNGYAQERRCGDVASAQAAIASAQLSVGALTQAIETYGRVLAFDCQGDEGTSENANTNFDESQSIDVIALLCETDGHKRARTISANRTILWTAWDLGKLARIGGNFSGALACHQLAKSLAFTENTKFGANLEIAEDLLAQGSVAEANQHMQVALREYPLDQLGDDNRNYYRSRGYLLLGKIAGRLGDENAREHYASALRIFENRRDSEGKFSSLVGLGESAERSERESYFSTADKVLSTIRLSSPDPAYRAALFAGRRNLYTSWVQYQLDHSTLEAEVMKGMSSGPAITSLSISERSRSRLLADLLVNYDVSGSNSKKKPGKNSFVTSRNHRNPTTASAMRELQVLGNVANMPDDFSIAKASKRIQAAQKNLPNNVAVIEYLLGSTVSYAWVVSKDRLIVETLPSSAIIEVAVDQARKAVLSSQLGIDPKKELAQLYELLFRPLEPHIGNSEIVVVADESLHRIPFAAFWDSNTGRYLVESRAITYAPSIAFISARNADGDKLRNPRRMLLIGDPVYEKADFDARCSLTGLHDLAEVSEARKQGWMKRLVMTGKELKQVRDAATADTLDITLLDGCDATQAKLVEHLETYDVIHIAAHATVDTIVPQQSGIHLTRFDRLGNTVDGTLSIAELLGSSINSTLTVLSGCSTAGGYVFGGEGPISLAFAIRAAGGRYVLSTLWPTADASSPEFMTGFYANYFHEQQSPAKAVRSAQIVMLNNAKWSHPKYWAGYVLAD